MRIKKGDWIRIRKSYGSNYYKVIASTQNKATLMSGEDKDSRVIIEVGEQIKACGKIL